MKTCCLFAALLVIAAGSQAMADGNDQAQLISHLREHADRLKQKNDLAGEAQDYAALAKLEATLPDGAAAAAKDAELAEAIVSAPGFAASNPTVAANVSAEVIAVVSTSAVASAAPALAAQVAVQATYVANVPSVATDAAVSSAVATVTNTVSSMETSGLVSSSDVNSAASIGATGNQSIAVVVTTSQPIDPTVISASE